MDLRKIKKLIDLLEESNLNEIEIKEGEESVRLSRGGVPMAMPMPQMIQAAPAPAAAAPMPMHSPVEAATASRCARREGAGASSMVTRPKLPGARLYSSSQPRESGEPG